MAARSDVDAPVLHGRVALLGLVVLGLIGLVLVIPHLLTQDAPATRTPAARSTARAVAPSPAVIADAGRPFAGGSVWNTPLTDADVEDPRSAALMGRLRQALDEGGPGRNQWIQTTSYSTPVYEVPRSTPLVRVRLDVRAPYARTLQRALNKGVPIPDGAQPAAGTDGHLTIWQRSTDRLWEFWKARKAGGTWRAAWGGAMRPVSRSPGYYTRRSWPGAKPYWGAAATSLPLLGGLMRPQELGSGVIDHALALAVPFARRGAYAFPAQRSDGRIGDEDLLPEGARLRLAPGFDVSTIQDPVARAMATAAQRYGIVVRDQTGHGVAFYAEAPKPGEADPYAGPAGLFQGKYPNDILAAFPWDQVVVVKMDLRRTR